MISSIRPKQSISAKEMPKNHTDKERFAAASSCFATGILTLLFPAQTTAFLSQSIISHRVLEAVASRILKSLFLIYSTRLGFDVCPWPSCYPSRTQSKFAPTKFAPLNSFQTFYFDFNGFKNEK